MLNWSITPFYRMLNITSAATRARCLMPRVPIAHNEECMLRRALTPASDVTAHAMFAARNKRTSCMHESQKQAPTR
jgi:hypothetical protein